MVSIPPGTVIDYILSAEPQEEVLGAIGPFAQDFPYLYTLSELKNNEIYEIWRQPVVVRAVYLGNVDIVRHLHGRGDLLKNICVEYAANGGHLECLKYVLNNGFTATSEALHIAARQGHLSCVKHLHSLLSSVGGLQTGSKRRTLSLPAVPARAGLHLQHLYHDHGCNWWASILCTVLARAWV